jgi:HSP20 family protein
MYQRFRTPSKRGDLYRMQRELEKLFNDYSPKRIRTAMSFPAINVWANEDSALITAEIPGVKKDELEINVTGDTLTVSGDRIPDDLPADSQYHRRERTYGKFSRSIQLPYTVDVDHVSAIFTNGVLEVILPRIEAEKPKKISIKTS